jgi:hypothetical protein
MNKLISVALVAVITLNGCGDAGSGSQKESPRAKDPPNYNTSQSITVNAVNNSAATPIDWKEAIAALNLQLVRDVGPVYNFKVNVVESTTVASGIPTLLMEDHLTGNWTDGTPFDSWQGYHLNWTAHVNYQRCLQNGTWQVTASHELLEMLSERSGGPEICDPVAPYGYSIDLSPDGRKLVSDFVYPQYYQQGSNPPYDFLKLVKQQGVPAPGGIK